MKLLLEPVIYMYRICQILRELSLNCVIIMIVRIDKVLKIPADKKVKVIGQVIKNQFLLILLLLLFTYLRHCNYPRSPLKRWSTGSKPEVDRKLKQLTFSLQILMAMNFIPKPFSSARQNKSQSQNRLT